jgi:hypothetical protein
VDRWGKARCRIVTGLARTAVPGGLLVTMVLAGAVAGSVSVAFTIFSVLGSCPSWDRIPDGRPVAAWYWRLVPSSGAVGWVAIRDDPRNHSQKIGRSGGRGIDAATGG